MSELADRVVTHAEQVIAATPQFRAAVAAGKDFAYSMEHDLPVAWVILDPGEYPPAGRDWKIRRFDADGNPTSSEPYRR